LKKERIPPVQTRLAAAYKRYILFLSQQQGKDEDLVIFDAQNGTFISVKTGLSLFQRHRFSFCYWKDNIFVLYGGTLIPPGMYYADAKPDLDVHFLYVIEKDGRFSWNSHNNTFSPGQVSIEVESCHLEDPELWMSHHSAQIYQNQMYVIGKKSQDRNHPIIVNKFDLSKTKLSSSPYSCR